LKGGTFMNSKPEIQNTTLVEVKNMFKNFGATVALNNVSFTLPRGQVIGLIGENGSGKSTVSSIIAGIQSATKGEMSFDGKPWDPKSMLEAEQNGIGIIVQESGTIGQLTVAQTIFLGHETKFGTGPFISRSKMNKAAQDLLDKLELIGFKATDVINDLDFQARKLVEIAKCLYWEPQLLIIDETTTALSHDGREFLYRIMAKQKELNRSVLFISHDLDEMMTYCDVLTVLRDGVIIGTMQKAVYDASLIRHMMVGREVKGDYYRDDEDSYGDEVVLKADHITTMEDLLCFNLELHKGEILGIGGLAQCGMHMVGQALFGIEPILDGEVRLMTTNTVIKSPKVAISQRMGYVSKNRDTESLGLEASIYENISSTGFSINTLFGPFISEKKENAYVDEQIKELSIKCASKHHQVSTLSGGNKQKVVFGKWMASDAQILILDSPTRGVDVGVKAAMYQLIYDMKKAGKSILLISEELQELIGMSDRILMMKNGEITGEFMRSKSLSEHDLIDFMI
jgi:ribose transport system ATP-binding protein